MKSYGQFCSIARALELLGERWTLLIVRELMCGSIRFNEVRRGIPRISRTMLSARLRELRDAGVIREEGSGYALTEAGRELAATIRELGVWGQRWLPRRLAAEELDAEALLWDIRRRIDADALPKNPIVARIQLEDTERFLLLRRGEVALCTENPGFPIELSIRASLPTFTAWWRGDLDLSRARAAGMVIEGRREHVRAFPRWFERYSFADIKPALR